MKTDDFVDKVLTGLDKCVCGGNVCLQCPYKTDDCMVQMMSDAAKLIRKQHSVLSDIYIRNKRKESKTSIIEIKGSVAYGQSLASLR